MSHESDRLSSETVVLYKRECVEELFVLQVLPFDPLNLTFHHLNYYVPLSKVRNWPDRVSLLSHAGSATRAPANGDGAACLLSWLFTLNPKPCHVNRTSHRRRGRRPTPASGSTMARTCCSCCGTAAAPSAPASSPLWSAPPALARRRSWCARTPCQCRLLPAAVCHRR